MKLRKRQRAVQSKPHKGPCYAKGCSKNGGTIHTCITCEKLVEAGELDQVFQVQCCPEHYQAGLTKIKRHALLAHPANVLRVIAAGLRGQRI